MRYLITLCFIMTIFVPALVAADEKSFNFSIKSGKLSEGPTVVRVMEGDRATLTWRSDQPVEIHLHGYDVLLEVTAGQAATMTVDCTATGRFPITLHGEGRTGHSHRPLTYLEVHPK